MAPLRLPSFLVIFGVASAAVFGLAAGCTSTPISVPACMGASCGGGGSDAGGVDASSPEDADVPGDATHKDEQPPPSVTYGTCAVSGGFGWPCTADASGPDPSECTDPRFSICFVGAQASRCTALCGDAGFAGCPEVDAAAPDAGCAPTDCNARGFCK